MQFETIKPTCGSFSASGKAFEYLISGNWFTMTNFDRSGIDKRNAYDLTFNMKKI